MSKSTAEEPAVDGSGDDSGSDGDDYTDPGSDFDGDSGSFDDDDTPDALSGSMGSSAPPPPPPTNPPDGAAPSAPSTAVNGMDPDMAAAPPQPKPRAELKALTADAKQVRVMPPMFEGAKPSIVFDYPEYLGYGHRELPQEGLITLSAAASKELKFRIRDDVHEYNCVRNAFLRAGLRRTSTKYWNMLWAKHLTEKEYLALNPFQKVNHFPGSWGLGRKDRLARNLAKLQRDHGSKCKISAGTFFLPADRRKLQMQMSSHPRNIYILKPSASSCGRGIKLISGAVNSKLPKKKACIVQTYIKNPLLINGLKWDLRMYVLVTSFDPLRVYLADNGLCRFATEKYNLSHKNLKNRFAHLTNYSVNKRSDKFMKNSDATDDMYGSKWSFKALMRYLAENDVDTDKIRANIKDVVIKTLLSVESDIGSLVNRYFPMRQAEGGGSPCFEVFGFDILIDKALKAWIIEVNVSPSLSSSSPMDKHIKNTVMTDAFHCVGTVPYDGRQWAKELEARKSNRLLGLRKGSFSSSMRHRNVRELAHTPLTKLLPEEVQVITDYEAELTRSGHFACIFPVAETVADYAQYFQTQRNNNVLLMLWLTKWRRDLNRLRAKFNFAAGFKLPEHFKLTPSPSRPLAVRRAGSSRSVASGSSASPRTSRSDRDRERGRSERVKGRTSSRRRAAGGSRGSRGSRRSEGSGISVGSSATPRSQVSVVDYGDVAISLGDDGGRAGSSVDLYGSSYSYSKGSSGTSLSARGAKDRRARLAADAYRSSRSSSSRSHYTGSSGRAKGGSSGHGRSSVASTGHRVVYPNVAYDAPSAAGYNQQQQPVRSHYGSGTGIAHSSSARQRSAPRRRAKLSAPPPGHTGRHTPLDLARAQLAANGPPRLHSGRRSSRR